MVPQLRLAPYMLNFTALQTKEMYSENDNSIYGRKVAVVEEYDTNAQDAYSKLVERDSSYAQLASCIFLIAF